MCGMTLSTSLYNAAIDAMLFPSPLPHLVDVGKFALSGKGNFLRVVMMMMTTIMRLTFCYQSQPPSGHTRQNGSRSKGFIS